MEVVMVAEEGTVVGMVSIKELGVKDKGKAGDQEAVLANFVVS